MGYAFIAIGRWVNNYNKAVSMKTASEIVKFAVENRADVIVMERLNFNGKKKGSKKQRLACGESVRY